MKNRTTHMRRRGFSLLELLAVMSIMAMLTTLAVTSYFSAIRGMTRRSAVKHLANSLILARQRACMEGTRVSVMVYNEVVGYETDGKTAKLVPSYVICKEAGRISFQSSGKLIDEFAPLNKMFGTAAMDASYGGSVRLYNLTQGRWSNVFPSVKAHPLTGRASALQRAQTGAKVAYEIPTFGFVVNPKVPNQNEASWTVGDSYGLEAAPVSSLPRGFQFEQATEPSSRLQTVLCVTFQPDGSASAARTISVYAKGPPQKSSSVAVLSDGSITYDEKWN